VSRASRRWRVRLTAAAEDDFRSILLWTATQFGDAQAGVYAETLSSAVEALAEGPSVLGTMSRNDIGKGLFTLHVARQGRRGRHLVLFRVRRDGGEEAIEVLRLLHDAMDLRRHVPPTDETGE
jgi:toxin ParE1/3/4